MPNPNRPQPDPNSKRQRAKRARLAKKLSPGQRAYYSSTGRYRRDAAGQMLRDEDGQAIPVRLDVSEAWQSKRPDRHIPGQPRPAGGELAADVIEGDWLLSDVRKGPEWFGETDSLVYEGPYRNGRRVRGHGWMKGKNGQVVSIFVCDACREAKRMGCSDCRPALD